jgi:hypothetical protein
MAEKLDPKEVVDLQELLMSGIIQSEALINLLDRKGISTIIFLTFQSGKSIY